MSTNAPQNQLDSVDLEDGHVFQTAFLPPEITPDSQMFEALWSLHPLEQHEIMIHGRLVKTPRWQQAYDRNYHYTGKVNEALPAPMILQPTLAWVRETIDDRLNGILVNWYDGALGHYIGPHHDSTIGLVAGAPIVTISFGEVRSFRLTREVNGERRVHDFPTLPGRVFVMPFDTNLAWKHSVPKSARAKGRRISITLRAFKADHRD